MSDLASEQELEPVSLEPFRFDGSGTEFFRIWIVNIVLSVVTLGIYSAWAKVRTKAYFYCNSYLQESSFAYLASPMAILKGRIIAFGFIVGTSIISDIFPLLGLLLFLFILAITPWLVARSLRFNAINSSYRNVRFNFVGSWRSTAMAFLVWPLLALLSFGLLVPMALARQQKFMAGNSSYGCSGFCFETPVAAFYRVAIVTLAILVAGGAMVAGLSVVAEPLAGLLALVTYLVSFAYFRAHVFNITYRGIGLNQHGFEASMTTAGISWLYLSNMLGMVCTLGLFYPWARVRMARYKADCLNASLRGSLDQFVALETERVSALGEEMGEMLDLDIGL